MAHVRVSRELRKLTQNFNDYTYYIRNISTDGTNIMKWNCTYQTGHEISLEFDKEYPFNPPSIHMDGICDKVDERAWTPATTGVAILISIYHSSELEQRRKRWAGLLRTMPMMMLWRKRATERLYHPSRMDFSVID